MRNSAYKFYDYTTWRLYNCLSPGRSKPHEAMAAVMSRILAGSARIAAGGLRKREVEHGGSVETENQRKRRKLKVNHYKDFTTSS